MRFTAVTLDNFLSYEHEEIDLSVLDYAAIAGRNGSGKSTIALAIAWALFGTSRVHTDSDSVIRDFQNECAVTLEFSSQGTNWRIERGKKRGKPIKVRLYSQNDSGEWDPYGDHLNVTAQNRIEDLVGMNEDSFYSLVLIDGASGARFIHSDSKARRDILLNNLPEMAAWTKFESQAREMLASEKATVEATQNRLDADEERLTETNQQVADARERLAALDADTLPTTLNHLDGDIRTLEDKIAAASKKQRADLDKAEAEYKTRKRELRADVSDATANAKDAQASVRALSDAERDLSDAQANAKDDADAVTTTEKALADAQARLDKVLDGEDAIDELKDAAASEREAAAVARSHATADAKSLKGLHQMQDDHAAECPTCQTHLDDDALATLIDRIEKSQDEANARAEKHQRNAEKATERARALDKQIDDAEDDVRAAKRTLDTALDRIERTERDLERFRARLDSTITDTGFATINDAQEAADRARTKVAAAEEAYDRYLTTAEAELDRLEDALQEAEEAATSGKDGRELDRLKHERTEVADKIRQADTLTGQVRALSDTAKSITERMRERQESIKASADRADALEYVVAACRPQGIPSMLLDGVLAPIETEATTMLNSIPGGEGWAIRFEQARALKSRAGAREVLDIIITFPTGAQRPIESLSSGERVRVSMAIIFAMLAVLGRRRGGEAIDTVFLDEPLGPLDPEAVPDFVAVLHTAVAVKQWVKSILVVSHDQRVIDALPQKITVEREATGVSHATVTA